MASTELVDGGATEELVTEKGTIRACGRYSIKEVKRVMGWGDWAWREARGAGLRVLYLRGRAFVRGDDLIAYFDQTATDHNPISRDHGPGNSDDPEYGSE